LLEATPLDELELLELLLLLDELELDDEELLEELELEDELEELLEEELLEEPESCITALALGTEPAEFDTTT